MSDFLPFENGKRRFLFESECQVFLVSADRLKIRDRAVCYFLYETGALAVEATQVTLSRLDISLRTVKLENLNWAKRGLQRFRTVAISSKLSDMLSSVLSDDGAQTLADTEGSVFNTVQRTFDDVGIVGAHAAPRGLRDAFLIRHSDKPYHILAEALGETSEVIARHKKEHLASVQGFLINESYIRTEYDLAVDKSLELLPIEEWAISPRHLTLSELKSKFGLAHKTGEIEITTAFLGTSSFSRLRNTIRHELAHLAVGLEDGHGRKFKLCAERFGANMPASNDEEEQVRANIKYKWTVIAHMADGSAIDMGGVHKRTKLYTDYSPEKRKSLMRIKDVVVSHFEFIENGLRH